MEVSQYALDLTLDFISRSKWTATSSHSSGMTMLLIVQSRAIADRMLSYQNPLIIIISMF